MPEVNPSTLIDLENAEAELQRELRSMFEVDTQTYLQSYLQLTQQLSTESWTEDIQEIYRCIHTIKGGAVTVNANTVLQTTTLLEDLLSDLRYLQTAPPLEDGQLSALLGEAGEFVTSSLLIEDSEKSDDQAVQPLLDGIKRLHERAQELYLNEVDEHLQLCQDFGNQGFDLVILDLELALESQPETGMVSPDTINTAAQVLTSLETVGNELEIGPHWSQILQVLYQLLLESDVEVWRSHCQQYLPMLKRCALAGGELPPEDIAQLPSASPDLISDSFADPLADPLDFGATSTDAVFSPDASFTVDAPEVAPLITAESMELSEDLEPNLDWLTDEPWMPEAAAADANAEIELDSKESVLDPIDEVVSAEQTVEAIAPAQDIPESTHPELANLELTSEIANDLPLEDLPSEDLGWIAEPEVTASAMMGDAEAMAMNAEEESSDALEWVIEPDISDEAKPQKSADAKVAATNASTPTAKIPKIPVPLDRLDRSAQSLIDILLAARSTQGLYKNLEQQLSQMVMLAQENFDYISQLREMQDDYALLKNLEQQNSNGPQLESYRTGYTVINRLLENSLRLSEIGLEASSLAQRTTQGFDKLDVNIQSLQHTVEESRLLPFKTVAFRLRAVLRDLISRMGKPAQLFIEGETQDLDAGTIQVLEPALLHLMRNAYDHGLETVDERQQTQKDAEGTLMLALHRKGNYYHLTFKDDGRGIDRDKICRIATEKNLPLTATDTDANLLAVLCQPGFSSQSTVSAVSGRGVGMDVVKHQVQSIGGTLTLETSLGHGSLFELKIPVPQLLVPCVVVKASAETFAIPAEAIQTMRLWNTEEIHESSQDPLVPWVMDYQGSQEPVLPFLSYWRGQTHTAQISETAVCLRIQVESDQSQQALWIVIDDLLEEMDLLINTIPDPIIPPQGLMGMSLLPTGQMIPVIEATVVAQTILEPTDVVVLKEQTEAQASDETQASRSQETQLILVVDDAALLRRRLEVSLVTYGYQVQTCRDGLEAWTWLQSNPQPTLMITDIEMPQMDGFTLVDHCRKAEMTFPILVSSSRLSEEWSKEATRVGADEYLTKGFTTAELISQVSTLIEAQNQA